MRSNPVIMLTIWYEQQASSCFAAKSSQNNRRMLTILYNLIRNLTIWQAYTNSSLASQTKNWNMNWNPMWLSNYKLQLFEVWPIWSHPINSCESQVKVEHFLLRKSKIKASMCSELNNLYLYSNEVIVVFYFRWK